MDFMVPIVGSLKTPCTTSYRSSMDSIALNCLVFDKIAFFWHFSDRQTDGRTKSQTDKQMDSSDALSRSRYRERRLNNKLGGAARKTYQSSGDIDVSAVAKQCLRCHVFAVLHSQM